MRQEEVSTALHLAFIAAWAPTNVAYTFANEDYDPPTDTAWVRMLFVPINGAESTIGSPGLRTVQRPFMIRIEIFTPRSTGTERASELVDLAIPIFEGYTNSENSIRIGTAQVSNDGVVRDLWYRTLVDFDGYYRYNR